LFGLLVADAAFSAACRFDLILLKDQDPRIKKLASCFP
jgi:hypothetical protein